MRIFSGNQICFNEVRKIGLWHLLVFEHRGFRMVPPWIRIARPTVQAKSAFPQRSKESKVMLSFCRGLGLATIYPIPVD